MNQLEISDYINEPPVGEYTQRRVRCKTERNLCRLVLLSVGILCIVQAALNVSLRLVSKSGTSASSRKETAPAECNATRFFVKNCTKEIQDGETMRPKHCNRLQERFNALTREKNELENQVNMLNNMLKMVTEERNRLRSAQRCDSTRVTASSQRCPSEWREVNFSCYFLSTAAETWEISRKRCQSKGGDLAVIKGNLEQRALSRLDADAGLLFWIGLRNNTGTFQWVDGSALMKSFWSELSADGAGPDCSDACVGMIHGGPLLANWDIASCGLKRRWLCEKSLM